MTIGDKFVLNVLSVLFITNTDCSDGHGLFKTKTLKIFRVDKYLTLNYRELYVNFRTRIARMVTDILDKNIEKSLLTSKRVDE